MEGIYKLNFAVGRRESPLRGVFIIDDRYVKYAVDNEVVIHFGEVAGKHSDVTGYIDPSEITLVTTDENVINLFKEHNLATGYNPFNYPIVYWKDEETYGEDYADISLKEVIDKKLQNPSS